MTARVHDNIILDINDLVVSLGKGPKAPRIIDGVSLQVREGETLCVVGESGSGKSVTSLTVMGLLQKGSLAPTAGSVKLVGEELLTASDRRLRQLRATTMAMIFQEPMTALNPVVPVGRQIDEVLRAHTALDARARRQRILDMMEQVRLPEVKRIFASYPHRLSGGQRQRIMIAMALVLEPKLLIADEPTTALDVTTQKQILHPDPRPAAGSRHRRAVHHPRHGRGRRDRRSRRGDAPGPAGRDRRARHHPAQPDHGVHPQPALGGAEPGAARAAH